MLASAKAKLVKERDSLAQTSKKLARDLAKVIAFCDVIQISVLQLVSCKLTLVLCFFLSLSLSLSLLFLLTDIQPETFKRHLMQSLGDDNSQVS